jgi:hypothetical protein
MTTANGSNGKTAILVLTYLVPALIAGAVGKFASVNTQGEQIAVLQTEVRATQARLDHIETKIDRLIEQMQRNR